MLDDLKQEMLVLRRMLKPKVEKLKAWRRKWRHNLGYDKEEQNGSSRKASEFAVYGGRAQTPEMFDNFEDIFRTNPRKNRMVIVNENLQQCRRCGMYGDIRSNGLCVRCDKLLFGGIRK